MESSENFRRLQMAADAAKELQSLGINSKAPVAKLKELDEDFWQMLRKKHNLVPTPVRFSYIQNKDGTVTRLRN